MSNPHFTQPTTTYWQEFQSKGKATPAPWKYGYPAQLPNSRILMLPIRQIAGQPSEAVASLIINQASLSVHDELGDILAEAVRDFDPEVVIGLPTLGLTLAKVVAQSLGKGTSFPSPLGFLKQNKKVHGLSRSICAPRLLPEILVFRQFSHRGLFYYLAFGSKEALS